MQGDRGQGEGKQVKVKCGSAKQGNDRESYKRRKRPGKDKEMDGKAAEGKERLSEASSDLCAILPIIE